MSRLEKIPVYLHKTIFEKVFDIATYSRLNKEERMAYDISMKRRWDEYSIKETIKKTAFNDGKKEGKRSIALELLKNGLPIDLIVKTTGLSEEEIVSLKPSLK